MKREERSGGKGKEKVNVRVRGAVSVCMVLSPGKADVLYLPGNSRQLLQKPPFHR